MSDQNQIDLSAGLVPKQPAIDLSAGLVPKPANPADEASMFQQATSGAAIPTPTPVGMRPQDQPTPVTDKMEAASDAVEDFGADVALGAGKGAAETLAGGAQLANRAIRGGVNILNRGGAGIPAPDKWIPEWGKTDDYLKAVTGDPSATLEAHGIGQNVGKIGETVAEFMIGEGELKALTASEKFAEISKAMKVVEKYPVLARVVTNSMRAAALGGVQNLVKTAGENPVGSLETGAITGGTTLGVEGGASLATPAAKWLFQYLNAPETLKTAQEALEATKASSEEALKIAKRALYPEAENLSGTELSEQIQKDLKVVRQQMSNDYEDARGAVTQKVEAANKQAAETGGQQIQVGGDGSPIQEKARELGATTTPTLPQTQVESALSQVKPDLGNVQGLLDAYANDPAPMSWDAAEAQRQALRKAIDGTAWDDPARRVLIQLKRSLDESMEVAADAAGHTEVATDMVNLRNRYAQTISKLEDNAVIRNLQNKDYDNVANVLMGRESVKNFEDLRQLLTGGKSGGQSLEATKTMDAVEAAMFQRLVDKSTVTAADGTSSVSAGALTQKFNQIPEEVRQAIWGGRAQRIAETVAKYQEQINAGVDAEKAAQDTVDKAVRILGVHGLPAVALTHAVWKAMNGDFKGAAYDAAGIAAWEGGVKGLSNPAVQRGVLSMLEALGQISTKVGVKITSDVPETAESLVNRSARGTTPFGTAPELPNMAGQAADTQVGLPEGTKVTPTDITDELEQHVAAQPAQHTSKIDPSVSYESVNHGATHTVDIKQGGNIVGNVIVDASNPKSARVVSSLIVPEDLMGKGLGQEAYLIAAKQAFDNGATELTSDTVRGSSPEATKMWQRLARRGKAEAFTPKGSRQIAYKITPELLNAPEKVTVQHTPEMDEALKAAEAQVGDVKSQKGDRIDVGSREANLAALKKQR